MSKTKTKTKDKLVKGDIITLKSKVMVSDPCYEIPTWCQKSFTSVKPGKYHTFVLRTDEEDWGIRCARLFAIHEDAINKKFDWFRLSVNIGVDSGQAGIFSLETYRNDKIANPIKYPKGDWNEDDLKKYWVQKFMDDKSVASIPAEREAFFELVFSHPEFKFASQKDD